MTPKKIAQWTSYALDFVALAALAATLEVHPYTAGGVVILLGLRLLSVRRLKYFFLLFSILVLCLGLYLWLHLHFPLILSVANTAPLLHASLWLMAEESTIARGSQLRLAIGFSELILTSILTSEVYLILSVFLFSILASVSISCSFLDKAFHENQESGEKLSPRYMLNIGALAFLVLLSGIFIFPILPRGQLGGDLASSFHSIGYTEDVTLDPSARLSGSRGGRTLIKIYHSGEGPKVKEEISNLIPYGLLRTRTLNLFDGINWKVENTLSKKIQFIPVQSTTTSRYWLQFDREPLNSDSLPVPYGTLDLQMIENSFATLPRSTGEWLNPTVRQERTRYRVGISRLFAGVNLGSGKGDRPLSSQTMIPPQLDTIGIRKITKKIFRQNSLLKASPEDRVMQLRSYFEREKFSALVNNENRQSSRLPPVAEFLFITRKGNCELFASAAALLLRLNGIPTRLVTGFRISKLTQAGVLSVKSSDAHAWVEYWVEGKGWKIYDPTPRVPIGASLWNEFLNIYDTLESLWYFYAYSYDANSQISMSYKGISKAQNMEFWVFSRDRWKDLTWILYCGIAILAFVLYRFRIVIFSRFYTILPRNKNLGSLKLRILRERMDRLIRRAIGFRSDQEFDLLRQGPKLESLFGNSVYLDFIEWREYYLLARFGSLDGTKQISFDLLNERESDIRKKIVLFHSKKIGL